MKKYFEKTLSIFLVLFMLLGALSACQADVPEASSPATENPFIDDPFEQNNDSNMDFLGWLQHGAVNSVLDENGLRAAYEYNGGKFELPIRWLAYREQSTVSRYWPITSLCPMERP